MGVNVRNGPRRTRRSAKFFLHPSINDELQQTLRADIKAYGGRVVSTDDHVDIVLVSATWDKELLRLRYAADDDKRKRAIHVERLSFVQHCIRQQQFLLRVQELKILREGNRQVSKKRFTFSDDVHLCTYLARIEPLEKADRRAHERLYERLLELGDEHPEFSWAKRHTHLAWRKRYEAKQSILNPIIEEIAKAQGTYDNPLPPALIQNGQDI